MKWKINGEPVHRNPSSAIKKPEKRVEYKRTIFGQMIRITPATKPIVMVIETEWRLANEELRNKLYLLYKNNESFLLETHIKNSSHDVLTVIIENFESEHSVIGELPRDNLYDMKVTFREVV